MTDPTTGWPSLRKHRYRIGLASELIVELFKPGDRPATHVTENALPDDARVVDATWDGSTLWLWFATDEVNPAGETPDWPSPGVERIAGRTFAQRLQDGLEEVYVAAEPGINSLHASRGHEGAWTQCILEPCRSVRALMSERGGAGAS